MSEGDELEVRARAATKSVLDRKKRQPNSQSVIDQLGKEVAQLRKDNERLLETKSRSQDDLQGLTAEVEQLRTENERLCSLMEALVAQIERHLAQEPA